MPKSLLVLLSIVLLYVFTRASFTGESPHSARVRDTACGTRYGEQKMVQFRSHYLTKELAYVSTPISQVPMDTKMILKNVSNWPDG